MNDQRLRISTLGEEYYRMFTAWEWERWAQVTRNRERYRVMLRVSDSDPRTLAASVRRLLS